MAIRKLKGSWWVDFRYHRVRYRKRSPLNSVGGAREYESMLRSKLAHGISLAPSEEEAAPQSFAEFASTWMDTHVQTNNKPSGIYAKTRILNNHLLPWFGHVKIQAITTRDVDTYKSAKLRLGYAAKSVNTHLAVLGKCLSSAVEWNALATRPTIKLLRVPPSTFRTITLEEEAALLGDMSEPMWNAIVCISLRTGMRPGELAALEWKDVDLEAGVITVSKSRWRGFVDSPKNNRVRTLPMTNDVHAAFGRVERRGNTVFCREDGGPISESARRSALARVCRRVGITQLNWYDLRHTFASTLAARGVPLPVVKELMGHATITMTMRYTHVTNAMLRDAVAKLDAKVDAVIRKNGQPAVNQTMDKPFEWSTALTIAA